MANLSPVRKHFELVLESGYLQVLAASGNGNRVLNVVDEARKRRRKADDERGNCSPIRGKLWRVTVHAVEVVHVGH